MGYAPHIFFHDSGLVLTCEHERWDIRRDIMAYQKAQAAGAAAPAAAAGAAATAAPAPAAIPAFVVCPYEGPTTTLDSWSKAWKAEVVAHTANSNPRDTSSFCNLGLTNDGQRFCKEHQIFCTAIADCNPDAPEETSVVPPERALRDHARRCGRPPP